MTHREIRRACVPVFQGFVAVGKRTATSQDFANELVKVHEDLARLAMTGLAKFIGDAFGKVNLPCCNRGYPKIYDLTRIEVADEDLRDRARIEVVDGDLRWRL
jgi:hypothetical protein